MKRLNIIFIVLMSFSFLSFADNAFSAMYCVKGSGKIITESRNYGSFDYIILEGSANLYLNQTNNNEIRIETDDNIIPLIKTEIAGNKLIISNIKSICPRRLNIYVNFRSIKGIKISGSGDIFTNSPINSKELTLIVDGAGNIQINRITSTNLGMKISGSGDIKINGTTKDLNIQLVGAGDVNAFNLQSETAKVNIAGSGDCRVYATDKLFVQITGSGDVHFRGKPRELKKRISGSGEIHQIQN